MRRAGSCDAARMPDFTVTVSGHLDGLIACDSPTRHGPLSLREDEQGQVLFEVTFSADSEDEAHQAVEVMPAAVAAICAIGWGAWVRARPSDWSVERPDGTLRVGKAVRLTTRARADLSTPPSMPGGLEAFWATLQGGPERVLELLNVLGLGLRASESADYVSGLWAFATVIEEEAPTGKNNIDHARGMADRLRTSGVAIPADPNATRLRFARQRCIPRRSRLCRHSTRFIGCSQ